MPESGHVRDRRVLRRGGAARATHCRKRGYFWTPLKVVLLLEGSGAQEREGDSRALHVVVEAFRSVHSITLRREGNRRRRSQRVRVRGDVSRHRDGGGEPRCVLSRDLTRRKRVPADAVREHVVGEGGDYRTVVLRRQPALAGGDPAAGELCERQVVVVRVRARGGGDRTVDRVEHASVDVGRGRESDE